MNVNSVPIFKEGEVQLGKLTSANMNVDTDQAITLLAGNKRITRILVVNPSTSLTTAVGGVYSTTAKGGYTIIAAAQVYSALTGSGLELSLTLAKPYFTGTTAYLFARV